MKVRYTYMTTEANLDTNPSYGMHSRNRRKSRLLSLTPLDPVASKRSLFTYLFSSAHIAVMHINSTITALLGQEKNTAQSLT